MIVDRRFSVVLLSFFGVSTLIVRAKVSYNDKCDSELIVRLSIMKSELENELVRAVAINAAIC